jgi:hypothetical protein
MRKLLVLAIALTGSWISGAEGPTSYSGGLPLLKRRPFKPDAESDCFRPSSSPTATGTMAPKPTLVRGPISSPYSMIRYESAKPSNPEKLPEPSSKTSRDENLKIPVEPVPAPRADMLPAETDVRKPVPR